MTHVTHVGATCRPTSETFRCQGQGEHFAQGGPHVDSLSDGKAGHGTWGIRGRLGSSRKLFRFAREPRRSAGYMSAPRLFATRQLLALSSTPQGPAVPLGLYLVLFHCQEHRFLPSSSCNFQPRPEAAFQAKTLLGFSLNSRGRTPKPSWLYGHRQNPSFSRAGFNFLGDNSLSHFHVLHRFGANDGTDWRMNKIKNKTAALS